VWFLLALRALYGKIDTWADNIARETATIDDLKFVLLNVGELQNASMDMQARPPQSGHTDKSACNISCRHSQMMSLFCF
jgi:hypothetical protein